MEKRVVESEKIGDLYKNFVSDVPKMMENYKAIISTTNNDISIKLEQTTREKQEAVARLTKAESELQTLKASDVERRRSIRTTIFLFQKENEDFAKFLDQVNGDQTQLVPILANSTDIREVLIKCGYRLEVNNDSSSVSKIFRQKKDEPPSEDLARFASWGTSGFYIIYANNRIVMDETRLKAFGAAIEKLREIMGRP